MKHCCPTFLRNATRAVVVSVVTDVVKVLVNLLLILVEVSSGGVLRAVSHICVSVIHKAPSVVRIVLVCCSLSGILDVPPVRVLNTDLSHILPNSVTLKLGSKTCATRVFHSKVVSVPGKRARTNLSLKVAHRVMVFRVILPRTIEGTLPTVKGRFVSLVGRSSILFCVNIRRIATRTLNINKALCSFIPPLVITTTICFMLAFALS